MKIKCYDYALRYINRYPKTEFELRIQLKKKGYFDEEIDKAICSLKRKNFVNDKMFIESYVYSELIKKGKPQIVVLSKLVSKGIDKSLVEDHFANNYSAIKSGIDYRIKMYIDKLKGKGFDGFDIIQKLKSKGYSIKDIKKAL